MKTLRDYQQECVDTIYNLAEEVCEEKMLVELATGAGKTVIFSTLPKHLPVKFGQKMLVVAHREELIMQAYNMLVEINPDLVINIENGDNKAPDSHIVVGSIQSLNSEKRKDRYGEGSFNYIIIDEAHHAHKDNSYGELINRIKPLTVIGFTATPFRSDDKDIYELFGRKVFSYGMEDLTEKGYLVPIEHINEYSECDLSSVKLRKNSYDESQLSQAIDIEERNEFILRKYVVHSDEKRAVIFCVNVQHCLNLETLFSYCGIPCAAIYGSMKKEDRKRILQEFSDGKILVVFSVGVLTEGFDEPKIETIILARPTLSEVLIKQMVGRGTRLSEGKESLKVINIVDKNTETLLSDGKKIEKLPAFELRAIAIRRMEREFPDLYAQHMKLIRQNEKLKERKIKEIKHPFYNENSCMHTMDFKHKYLQKQKTSINFSIDWGFIRFAVFMSFYLYLIFRVGACYYEDNYGKDSTKNKTHTHSVK